MRPADTIVGISSAAGTGLRGIVRLSGADAVRIVDGFFSPEAEAGLAALSGASAVTGSLGLAGGRLSLPAELLVFRAPRTYTREDIVEIHTFGSPPLLEMVVHDLCDAGARLADPGEFTLRAFESGRIDLTQVEAVLEIIRASNESEADQALRRYDGAFGRQVQDVRAALIELASRIEVHLDFSDQDIDLVGRDQVQRDVERLTPVLREIQGGARPGGIDSAAVTVALLGAPNAGKSSLFNALVGGERAVVTDVAGTTLDPVEQAVSIDGVDFRLIDAPGIRAGADDALERHAAERARGRFASADLVVVVIDGSRPQPDDLPSTAALGAARPRAFALHQADRPACITAADLAELADGAAIIETSAVSGVGLDRLRHELVRLQAEARTAPEAGTACANARQAALIGDACEALDRVVEAGEALPYEVVALEIREAVTHLGAVTGEDYSDSLLARIFADFCIGK